MKKVFSILFAIVAVFAMTTSAIAGTVILQWDPPLTDTATPPNPITNLEGYKIHYGTSSGSYTNHITVTTPCVSCPAPVSGLVEMECLANFEPGTTYYFVVTAFATGGTAESGYSNEVSKTFPAATCPLGNVAKTPSISLNRVDGYDAIFFSKTFGKRIVGSYCTAANVPNWTPAAEISDLNSDGSVDGLDQSILSANFGKSCGQ